MARAMQKAAAAVLLMLLLVAATTVIPSDAARPAASPMADTAGHRHHHGHGGRDHDQSPLAGLTECVTICGSGVTTCMLGCYRPLISFDPVELPVCLLKCTNDAMVCASGCSGDI